MPDKKAVQIAELLSSTYLNPKTELVFQNEVEFTVAVMLSAQTTDKKVNEITAKLFQKYHTWGDYAQADLKELQQDIRGVNFHLGKADRLIKAAHFILTEYYGQIPRTIDLLIKIPGIARKSANVILQELFEIAEGIVVDTHVTRLSNRLGLTTLQDAVKIEKDLMVKIPGKYWRNFSGALVLHGRYVCKARKPECANCVLIKLCAYKDKILGI